MYLYLWDEISNVAGIEPGQQAAVGLINSVIQRKWTLHWVRKVTHPYRVMIERVLSYGDGTLKTGNGWRGGE